MTAPGRTIIRAAQVLTPRGLQGPAVVAVEAGRIAQVVPAGAPERAGAPANRAGPGDPDAPGVPGAPGVLHMAGVLDVPGVLVPGFVDLQVNGAAGCDFLAPSPEGLRAAHRYLLGTGTVAYLPTLISAPDDRLRAALAFFAERAGDAEPPRILGVHLEGPFLSPTRAGAHRPAHLRRPSPEWMVRVLDEFPGVVRVVTLAPELPGALEVVDLLVRRGVVVAVGHTDATYDQAREAFARGARLVTHLFNAMRPYHHREPGVVGAALADEAVVCGVIADGVHLHPAVVDQVIRLKGADRTALVTDAISAAGMPPGPRPLTLGDREVFVTGGAPRLADGTLAGSVLAMDQAVRRVAARWGLELAVRMAASVPRALLGLEAAEISPGRPADLVALDRDLRPAAVVAGGRVAIQPDPRRL